MAEGRYVPCESSRKLTTADAFLGGTLDFPCQVGARAFSTATVSISALGVVGGLLGTLFSTGMPSIITGAPTGSSVQVGDILVVRGVHYPISVAPAGGSEIAFTVANVPSVAVVGNINWYIIRKDTVRSPQAKNTVYAVWWPPMGIFDYDGILGCGNYTFSLYPNSRYLTSAVETRNLSALPSIDGKTNDYSLTVNSITFFAYIAKVSIPNSIVDIPLIEFQVIPKPYESTVQFSVSPDTVALTFFLQDLTAGINPRIPQSMFKVLDNSDLKLASIQVSFGGTSKPVTEIKSNFYKCNNTIAIHMMSQDCKSLMVQKPTTISSSAGRSTTTHSRKMLTIWQLK